LLRYVAEEWTGAPNLLEDARWVEGRPHVRWSAARRRWIREHVHTRQAFDRLYADDVVYPPGTHRLIERDIDCVMTGRPRWRSDWRRAAQGP
jgi:hypothetical protein